MAKGVMTAAKGTWACLAMSEVLGKQYVVQRMYRGLALPGTFRDTLKTGSEEVGPVTFTCNDASG